MDHNVQNRGTLRASTTELTDTSYGLWAKQQSYGSDLLNSASSLRNHPLSELNRMPN